MLEVDVDALRTALYNAGNTRDVINWEKLAQRAQQVELAPTDRERVALVVRAANGEKLSGRQRNQLVGLPVLSGAAVDDAVGLTDALRNRLHVGLAVLVDGPDNRRTNLWNALVELVGSSVVLAPSWTSRGRRDRLIASGIGGALSYGLLLIADQQGEFFRDLARCQYGACGAFFFKQRLGKGRPSDYCCPDHRAAGTLEKAKLREEQKRRGNGVEPRAFRRLSK